MASVNAEIGGMLATLAEHGITYANLMLGVKALMVLVFIVILLWSALEIMMS